MEIFEYYILDDNDRPRKVAREQWKIWMDNVDIRRICVAETHLICRGNLAGCCVVNTRFTGCDRNPGLPCEPYLWETIITYMEDEPARYTSAEMAQQRHDDRVRFAIQLLKHESITVVRRDIQIRPTEKHHGTRHV